MLAMIAVMYPQASACARRIKEVIDSPKSFDEDEIDPKKTELFTNRKTRGIVKFNDVTFAYPDSEKPCISNISFETKPFEYEVLSKPKSEPKKTNIDELFKYDHSRIDLERIKANSESQRAIISGLSEFLKKIEIEKNKLQQKREEIEKKNQLAKQIINQGYDREKSFEFEKRN